jgi:hypothetical protein
MNCLCGASVNPQWPACLVCKRPIESPEPAEEAAVTLDLTREDHRQEPCQRARKPGDSKLPSPVARFFCTPAQVG